MITREVAFALSQTHRDRATNRGRTVRTDLTRHAFPPPNPGFQGSRRGEQGREERTALRAQCEHEQTLACFEMQVRGGRGQGGRRE